MKVNKWTLGLAAVGLVSLPALGLAEEKSNPVMSALSSTTISGYVSTSMQWKPGTGNARGPAYSYGNAVGGAANKADGFNLDVVKLTIEKPLDEDQWAAGYKVDLLFGQDARGLGTGSLGAVAGGNNSDFNIKQAYVALRAPVGNGLDFKVGVFDTVIGYESFDAGNNPNYTRSYGYTIEPTTHTGVLATYQFAEWIGMAAGVANTVGPQINEKAWNYAAPFRKAESYKTYMGSIVLTAPESFGFLKGSSLYGGVVNGFNRSGSVVAGVGYVQTSFYVGTTVNTPIAGLKVGASYDYLGINNRQWPGAGAANTSGYANASAAYISYQVTEKLSVHGRGEYFTVTPNGAIVSAGGAPTKVVALTGTIQYDLWKNVLSRLEVRWDHQADGNGRAYGATAPAAGTPAQTGSRRNSVLIAGNIIYKF